MNVIEDVVFFMNGGDDISKVIIGQDYIGGFFSNFGFFDFYSNFNIGLFEGWGVVDFIISY